MSFIDDSTVVLPPEQGSRAKSRDFWTKGPAVREPNRSPWERRYIVPRYNPFEQPAHQNPDAMPSWVRRQLERERKGIQWTQRLGKRAGQFVRLVRGASEVASLVNAIGGLVERRYSVTIPGMRQCDPEGGGGYPPIDEYVGGNGFWFARGSEHCTHFQLTGQAFGDGGFIPFYGREPYFGLEIGPGETHITVGADWHTNQLCVGWTRDFGAHWIEHSSHLRETIVDPLGQEFIFSPWAYPAAEAHAQVSPFSMPNPNAERHMPPDSQPIGQAQPVAWQGNIGDPGVAQDVLPELSPAAQAWVGVVPSTWGFAFTGGDTHADTVADNQPDAQEDPKTDEPQAEAKPPEAMVRERKVKVRSRMLLVALFKALDTASEWGDIVDAMYDALPKDVKKRWKCNRRVPIIDNFGQYGISNADCKSQALWWNWHRLNVPNAIENILMNEVEDAAYGRIHKLLPRNRVRTEGETEAWKAFAKWLKAQGFKSNDFAD